MCVWNIRNRATKEVIEQQLGIQYNNNNCCRFIFILIEILFVLYAFVLITDLKIAKSSIALSNNTQSLTRMYAQESRRSGRASEIEEEYETHTHR